MERNIGFDFKRIHVTIEAKVNSDLREKGLTFSQMGVMRCLFRNREGIATQKDIETFLSLKHPTVVGIIRRLEKNGFVTVSENHGPGRSKVVALTDKGKAVKDSLKESREAWERLMLRGFSDSEADTLQVLLERVHRNLTEGEIADEKQGRGQQAHD